MSDHWLLGHGALFDRDTADSIHLLIPYSLILSSDSDSEELFDMADRQDVVVESEQGKTRRAGSHRHRASKGGQQVRAISVPSKS